MTTEEFHQCPPLKLIPYSNILTENLTVDDSLLAFQQILTLIPAVVPLLFRWSRFGACELITKDTP